MLRCSGMPDTLSARDKMESLEKLLLNQQANWDIYQQFDPVYGEEFLVFLPKSLLPDKVGMEKLKALDFAADGTLKKIPLKEVLQGPRRKNDLNAFFHLFAENPVLNKLFYIIGHGGADTVAALKQKIIKNFQILLRSKRAKG